MGFKRGGWYNPWNYVKYVKFEPIKVLQTIFGPILVAKFPTIFKLFQTNVWPNYETKICNELKMKHWT